MLKLTFNGSYEFQLLVYEMKLQEVEIEMKSMDDAAVDAHKTIDTTQTDLNFISEELANLYYKVCNVQGVTAQRVMLDHMTGELRIFFNDIQMYAKIPAHFFLHICHNFIGIFLLN